MISSPPSILLFFASVLFSSLPPGVPQESHPRNEHQVMSTLWFQTSAEMRALSYQAFNVARMRIDEDLEGRPSGNGRAVVVDVDEAVLDNSPHSATLIKTGNVFPYKWTAWVNSSQASGLPGAAEFLRYAVEKGYEVFYVSNRSAKTEFEGTMRNLQSRGFPHADGDHILLMTDASTKKPRRDAIRTKHEIVLLIGDNLNDLSEAFEKKPIAERFAAVDDVRDAFGRKFIVIPNPMYGEWENAVYGYKRGLTEAQKDSMRKESLRGME